MRLLRFFVPIALVAILVLFAGPIANRSAAPSSGDVTAQLKELTTEVTKPIDALKEGDLYKARSQYKQLDEAWDKVGDTVKARSGAVFKQIEDAMDEVRARLVQADRPELGPVEEALKKLGKTIDNALPTLR